MRLAIMDTNAFNTIIAAVKGAVSASMHRPMYKNIRLEFRKKNMVLPVRIREADDGADIG